MPNNLYNSLYTTGLTDLGGFPSDILLSETQTAQHNGYLTLVAPPTAPRDPSAVISFSQTASATQAAPLPTVSTSTGSDGFPQAASSLDQTFAALMTFPTAATLFANPAANPAAPPTVPTNGPSSPGGAASPGGNAGSTGSSPVTNAQPLSATPPATLATAPGEDLWHGASAQSNAPGNSSGASPFDGPTGPGGNGGSGGTGGSTQPGNPGSLSWNGPSFGWSIAPPPSPVIINPGAQTSAEGDAASLQVAAYKSQGYSVLQDPTLAYAAVGLPKGLTINPASGMIAGTVDYQAAESVAVNTVVTLVVVNGKGASSAQTFTWNVTDTPRMPVLTNPGAQTNLAGAAVTLQVNASQIDGDRLTYGATGLPSGLSIDSVYGQISGTIDLAAGVRGSPYSVTVTATNKTLVASQTFAWVVGDVGTVAVTQPADQMNTEGDAVSLAVSASTTTGTLTFTADSLPAGLTIGSSTGVMSGTLAAGTAAAGPYSTSVAASNGTAGDNKTFNWTVNPRVAVDAIASRSDLEGSTISLSVNAHETGATLTYSATGLPSGLILDSSTGLISGTVASGASRAGPFHADVTVGDGTYNTDVLFEWDIRAFGK